MDLKGRITFDGWFLIYQRGSQGSSESQVKDRSSISDKGKEFYKSHCLNRLRDFTQTCIKISLLCDVWDSHVCDYESYYILGTKVVQSVINLPTFRRNKLTSPSGEGIPKDGDKGSSETLKISANLHGVKPQNTYSSADSCYFNTKWFLNSKLFT